MVWATSRSLTLVSLSCRLAKSVIPVATLWVAKLILDQVVQAIAAGGHANTRIIWKLVLIELALAVLNDLLARAISLSDSLLGDRFTNVLSLRLIEHASRLDLVCFEDPEFHDKLERARRQTSGRLGLLSTFASLGQELITLVTLSVGLIWFSPWLLLLLAVAVVPNFLGETHFAGLAYSLLYRWTPERRELDYVRMLGASAQSAKEVKLFDLGRLFLNRYIGIYQGLYEKDRNLTIQRETWGFSLTMLSIVALYSAYGWCAVEAVRGLITLGQMTMYIMLFRQGQSAVTASLGAIGGMYEDNLYLSTLYEYLEQPVEESTGTAVSGPDPEAGVQFEDVEFRYPGSDQIAITGINLQIKRGQSLALVGENGSGKTTLIKLLTRLYKPTYGRVLLDGRDLQEWDTTVLRRRVGVIFQDFVRYQLMVGENVGAGDVRAFEDRERWKQAATQGMAAPFIEGMPLQYDTQLGKWFKDGRELSGGQWQKIALSRAFMRSDADILVLDEPTAAMDAAAEAEVFEHFRSLMGKRIAIVISHRFSTVRMADQIVVLDNGHIAERGNHESLMQDDGIYAKLFTLQARGYR